MASKLDSDSLVSFRMADLCKEGSWFKDGGFQYDFEQKVLNEFNQKLKRVFL